ncbi:IS21 family transposase [Luteitalea sp. TBR-22]|uniref:IS21 family transposase n=1 Tax=Luteitalea sp. TBR-22 TaxID=2802971 RepID=UPI001EF463F0|nr:IS21 family transposase [Luteitalea sp. TBR-22]
MLEGEVVASIRALAARGVGSKRIAATLGVARNTVKRYLRTAVPAGVQVRPQARCLSEAARAEARRLYEGVAEGNAVVAHRLLAEQGVAVSVRTVERAVRDLRRARRVAEVATVRVETAPGEQLQVDFGQKRVEIAGTAVRLHLLVAVLSYSRRIFVKAFLHERQDEWREGLAAAFQHFGGVTRTVLGDNARALVSGRDVATSTVHFHPADLAFCRDWDVQPRACAPYRARTKGKTESGVKYVKRNALAGLTFASLETHLATWMALADQRIHGTTHEAPAVRFSRDEQPALRPLPLRALPRREQRVRRRVAADALVDIDTVRYSVPHPLVREHVEVAIGDDTVRIYHGGQLVATHRRSFGPHTCVIDPAHWAGLWRTTVSTRQEAVVAAPLASLGRSLQDYAVLIGGPA